METKKWEGKRSMNEAEEQEEEHENIEEDNKRKRVLTLSGRKVSGGVPAQHCCQVEQCTADMADAKTYHRRHKCLMKLKGVAEGVWQVTMSVAVRFHMTLPEKVRSEAASASMAGKSPTF
ncbi:hypothetical protein K7X08_033252 [Anisodus acutangulus]|uniref:Uncharacterized protein n=1 Tax=Anisodus acutangulus TaxID=402998 RepID=A0A9Q1M4V3_9SOLA|nr:hypothetical protein K7X08_033252 [Anisodus acutangulus]